MSVIDRVRSIAADRARSTAQGAINELGAGVLGDNLVGAIARGITQGPKGFIAAFPDFKSSAADLILGEVNRGLDAAGAGAQRLQDQLLRQASGRNAADGPPTVVAAPAKPKPEPLPPPTDWTPAPLWGGLTLEEYRRVFMESAMTAKAFKNLFHVQIRDWKPSMESPGGAEGFNLFALDVGFAPVTMPGEAVAIGSSNFDSLTNAERVEFRITTFDDRRGSIKRWFIGKSDQVARIDGTFGIPADYLLTLDITHMAAEPTKPNDSRLTHRYVVRTSSMDLELSRQANELELLQLGFVQWDTFYVAPK